MRMIGLRAIRKDVPAAGAAVACFAVLLYLGRGMTFYADEWVFITQRSLGTLEGLFAPHNEHWSTLALVVYRGLFKVVGLHSYLPYLAALLALHVAVAWAVYRLMLPAGRLVALLAIVLVLLLGAGWENLFWAFQIGTVGSAAAGAWAMVVARSDRRAGAPTAAGLLLGAIAFSGAGLSFVPAVAALIFAEHPSPRRIGWLLLPIGGYAAWYLIAGSGAVAARGNPFTPEAFGRIPEFLIAGGAASIDGYLGVGQVAATVMLSVLAIATAAHVASSRQPDPLWVAAIVALVTQYALIGLVRGQFGAENAGLSRYVYTGAIFVLLAALCAWREGLRRWPGPPIRFLLLSTFAVALLRNVALLRDGADIFQAHADDTRAIVSTMIEHAGDPAIDPDASRLYEQPYRVPAPHLVIPLVARFGSPLADTLVPSVVPPISPEVRDAATVDLIRHAILRRSLAASPSGEPLQLLAQADIAVDRDDAALRMSATAARAEALVRLPAGADLAVCAAEPGLLAVELGQLAEPTARTTVELLLGGENACEAFSIPDLSGLGWQMRIHLEPAMGELRFTAVTL